MENQKKKWRWSDVSKNVLICLIPPAVAASIITPIAIVAKNKQSQDTITLTYNDCFENGAITNKVNIKKGTYATNYQPKHRDGWAFKGWKTVKNDETAPFFNASEAPLTSNLTLYGYWTNEATPIESFNFEVYDYGAFVSWNGERGDASPKHIIVPSTVTIDGKKYKVTGVNSAGFAYLSDCESISLPDSIELFADETFVQCTKLAFLNMPKNLKEIGPLCFAQCKHLSELNLSECDLLTELHQYCFAGNNIFYDAPYIRKIHLPKNLSVIKEGAFCCSYLESIDFSQTKVTTIPPYCFGNCINLSEVILPKTLQTIGERSFEFCAALKTINIPKNTKAISYGAFNSCHSLEWVTFDEDCELLTIDSGAFRGCFSLKSIVFPKLLSEIGAYALADCHALKSIGFKSKNKWVLGDGDWTPSDDGVKNYSEIWEYISSIGMSIKGTQCGDFWYISDNGRCMITKYDPALQVNDVVIPATLDNNKVVGISQNVFLYNTNIESVTFDKDENNKIYLEYIMDNAFYRCTNLKSINLSECSNLKYICNFAFGDSLCYVTTTSTQEFDLSNTQLEYIGANAFSLAGGFDLIGKFVFPKTLTTIGSGAFNGRSSLSEIDFSRCVNFSSFEYYSYWWDATFQSVFANCPIEKLDLSMTKLEYIPESCFSQSLFKSIKLPSSIMLIGKQSFVECVNLDNFTIPKNCVYIDLVAFAYCSSLTNVSFEDATSKWYLTNTSEPTLIDYDDVSDTSKNAETLTNYPFIWIKKEA